MAKKAAAEQELVICVIYGREFLDLLLEAFLEVGISGATVLQSQGMGRILARDFPLFAGFRELLEAGGPFNYTVLSVVKDPALVEEVLKILPELKQGESPRGILFTVPISRFFKFEDLLSQNPKDV